jgi:hypothetical protein
MVDSRKASDVELIVAGHRGATQPIASTISVRMAAVALVIVARSRAAPWRLNKRQGASSPTLT